MKQRLTLYLYMNFTLHAVFLTCVALPSVLWIAKAFEANFRLKKNHNWKADNEGLFLLLLLS